MDYRDINRKLLTISLLHRVMIRRRTADIGPYIGQQFNALQYIRDHDGCTQAELAAFLHVTPASVALSTKRLQKTELIKKETDANNLRCNMLHVTDRAIDLLERSRREFEEFDEQTYAGFTEKELNTLMGILDRMIVNMNDGTAIDFNGVLEMNSDLVKNKNK